VFFFSVFCIAAIDFSTLHSATPLASSLVSVIVRSTWRLAALPYSLLVYCALCCLLCAVCCVPFVLCAASDVWCAAYCVDWLLCASLWCVLCDVVVLWRARVLYCALCVCTTNTEREQPTTHARACHTATPRPASSNAWASKKNTHLIALR
jgi:hypothetical protein